MTSPSDEDRRRSAADPGAPGALRRLSKVVFDAPVLRGLDARAEREIEAAAITRELAPGARLYAQGERADSFFVLAEGDIDLAAQRRAGAERMLVRAVRPGESFGEEATVIGRRHADAYARSRCVVVEIPVHLFRRAAVRSGRAELADRLERTLQRAAARDAIAGTPLAQSLDEEGLDAVLDAVTFHSFARNQVVYRQGDASVALFVVGDGLVQIQTDQDDRVRVHAYLGRGDFFGDEELESAVTRAASAISNAPSTVLAIPARVVRALALRDPEMFTRLRRVALGVGEHQRGVVRAAAKNATQHVFRDLYRVQVARSLLVIDLESCVRCGHCSWACGSLYGTSRLVRRGDKVLTRSIFGAGALRELESSAAEPEPDRAGAPRALMLPNSCQHCENPACMVDCPTGAIGKDPDGEVFIREELCTGCGACARACPWTNIQMAPRPKDAPRPLGIGAESLAVKCDLCRTYERGPACVQVCPTGAILRVDPQEDWGEVAELLGQRAHRSRGRASAPLAASWPVWSIMAGAGIAAAALAIVGGVMRSRGHWVAYRGAGYVAGWAAGAAMALLLSYALPKRAVRLWMRFGGRRIAHDAAAATSAQEPRKDRMRAVKSVTKPHYVAHVVLGLLAMALAIGHAPHTTLTRASAGSALLFMLYASGLTGVLLGALYTLVPRALSKIERTPLLPEDFAAEKSMLSGRLFKSLSGRDDLVKAVADRVLLPYARSSLGPALLVASGRDLRREQRLLRSRIDAALEGRGTERLAGIDDLVRIAVELRALPAQRVLMALLRVVLPVHIACFMAAMVLLVLHVVAALGSRPVSAKEHKTLFVAPQRAGPSADAPPPKAPTGDGSATSDLTRVRPAYVGALCGALGLIGAFFMSGPSLGAPATGPGPLTPSHVKAKLGCAKCHGDAEQGTTSFVKKAKAACVGCHGPHPSTRAGHQRLADEGKLGCVTCHNIHGPQSGVRFAEEGPAVRYFTNGTAAVPEVSFRSDRTVVIPTIPLGTCTASCHTTAADDPIARCRSHAGSGALEPTVCFDEHRPAVPPEAVLPTVALPRRPGVRAPDDRRVAAPAPSLPKSGVCADQHFEDRSFAWEAAREVVARVPTPPDRLAPQSSLGWFGAAAGFALLGYAGAAGAGRLRRRKPKRGEPKHGPAQAPNARKRLPVIDTSTCLGCYACVDACPYGVLEVERYVAVAARPDACCGLDLCEQRCPNGSLIVADEGTVLDRPRLDASLESQEVPGLYLAGDVTGIPLIKNAILQGAHAAERAQRALSTRPRADGAHDVCIIGAGPAGISAALRLQELGADAVVLEQGGVAQSIQNFPRGKLVFDQPLELPVEGKLWLKESSKEELLLHWMRIVRQKGLRIREQMRMTAVQRLPNGIFAVQAMHEEAHEKQILARSIILAVGTRGSPRKLAAAIPAAAEARVHYHLADARSLAGRRILVIGLGDSAMEAAIALAGQPRTSVTILARAATYARGQARNIAEVERLRKARRLEVRFGIDILEVQDGWLVCRAAGKPGEAAARSENLPFEAMFVLIGSIPPWDTLRRAGISSSHASPPGPAPGSSVFVMNPAAPVNLGPTTPPSPPENQS